MFGKKTLAMTFLLLLFAASAVAQDFKADMIVDAQGRTMEGVMYRKGDELRQEMTVQEQPMIMIINTATGRALTLDETRKVYLEQPGGTPVPAQERLEKIAEKTEVGTEEFAGYETEVIKWDFDREEMGTMTQWYATELDFPIKTKHEMPNGQVVLTQMINIEEADLAPELFMVPEGYEQVVMPQQPGAQPQGEPAQ